MRNRIIIALGALVVIILLWVGYTFGVKPTITIQSDGNVFVSVSSNGKTVYSGQDASFRLDPGSYIVQVTSGQHGISKKIDVSPFGSATIALPKSTLLHTSLVAPAALFQPFPVGSSYIGFDPTDTTVKRLTESGTITLNLNPAITNPEADPTIPGPVTSYQTYQDNQAIVASDGRLFVVGSTSAREISTVGIDIEPHAAPEFIIAAQPQSAAFVVGYKKDLYLYDDVKSKPKKIYTAKKQFDHVVFGGSVVGIYGTRIPPSKQDLRPFYDNHQNDLLLIDTAANNKEHTLAGPLSGVTLNTKGNYAVIQPRLGQPYLYDIPKKEQVTTVDIPLTAGPYWTSDTTYLYSRDVSIWQYDVTAQQSTLMGQLPIAATAFYKDSTGAITVSAYANAQSAGIYRLGEANAATQATDKLKSALPYNDNSMSITYTTLGDKPRVTITTKAPLNSASQLDRYKRETAELRQKALDYLKAQGVDPATLTITYDPADPL